MKTVAEFKEDDLGDELEHAYQMALASINYTFNDSKDSEFVTENEIEKIYKALDSICMIHSIRAHHTK